MCGVWLKTKKSFTGFNRQVCYTFISYAGTFLFFGCVRGYMAFLLQQLRSNNSIIRLETSEEESLIVGLGTLPSTIGSIISGYVMDAFGRRISLQIAAVSFTIGWCIVALSKTSTILFIGIAILGTAIGLASTSTVYVAEISEPKHRSFLISILEIFYSTGLATSYTLNYIFTWNITALIFTFLSILLLTPLFFVPESPYWLLKNIGFEAGMKSLKRIRDTVDENALNIECLDILSVVEKKKENPNCISGLKTIFKYWKPFTILFVFNVLLQGCGFATLICFLPRILERLNFHIDNDLASIGFSIFSLLASFITPFSANRWSRRKVTMMSGFGMMVSMIAIALSKVFNISKMYGWTVNIWLFTYMFSCTIGVLALTQAMISELYPTEVRGIMSGYTGATATLIISLAVTLYPIVEKKVDILSIIWFFAFFSLVSILFGKFVLPETHGKTLNQIQIDYFSKRNTQKNADVENGEKNEDK